MEIMNVNARTIIMTMALLNVFLVITPGITFDNLTNVNFLINLKC